MPYGKFVEDKYRCNHPESDFKDQDEGPIKMKKSRHVEYTHRNETANLRYDVWGVSEKKPSKKPYFNFNSGSNNGKPYFDFNSISNDVKSYLNSNSSSNNGKPYLNSNSSLNNGKSYFNSNSNKGLNVVNIIKSSPSLMIVIIILFIYVGIPLITTLLGIIFYVIMLIVEALS